MPNSFIYTSSIRPAELWTGLKGFWDAKANTLTPQHTKFMSIIPSDQRYEVFSERRGIGIPQPKAETFDTAIQTPAQGIKPVFENTAYGLGIQLSWESIKDNLYEREGKDKIEDLRKSFFTRKEIDSADLLNNGFSSSYLMTGGDGQPLFSTAHVDGNGTFSNKLSVDADLSETAVEDMLILIANLYDTSGVHKAFLEGEMLGVANENWFVASRILQSTLQNDSANNAINAIMKQGALSKGFEKFTYFTDPDAWFVFTSCNMERGLTITEREKLELLDDSDTRKRVYSYYGYERYATGWRDVRGVVGSQGA